MEANEMFRRTSSQGHPCFRLTLFKTWDDGLAVILFINLYLKHYENYMP